MPKADSAGYGRKALAEECAAIRSAGFGQQAIVLNSACFKIGTLAGAGLLDQTEALAELRAAAFAMRSQPGREPWRQAELERRVLHSFQAGLKHPRQGRLLVRQAPTVQRAPWAISVAAEPMPDDDLARRISRAARIWNTAGPLWGSPGEAYLRDRRGLAGLPENVAESLRFHPACPCGPAPHTRFLPALVGLLRDIRTDEPTGIRRIFIEPDGAGRWDKMAGGGEKLALGRAAGAVVKLSPDEDVTTWLALGEGIETSLSLLVEAPGKARLAPVWAAGAAGIIGAFPVLPGVEALLILADRDPAGLKAAEDCRARWRAAEREVRVIPPARHKDWNDVLRRAAA